MKEHLKMKNYIILGIIIIGYVYIIKKIFEIIGI
tara:strand:+ start:52 stop:153 length:102 start_codon:yes stop_codon:yes gene_type:complete